MKSKLTEQRIVGLLVILLGIETALLSLHLGWGGFHWVKASSDSQIAGHVLRSENELRRRGNNSLVWEKSGSDDSVYFYDSILTLSQSTASLKLYQDTEVKLSENTLVTIEPQDTKNGGGEIRLKFVKGSLKARNPFATTKVENESWSMEIKSGSEVDVRQVGEHGFELEVSKGEVAFKSATGESKVSGSQVLKIENDHAEKIVIDESLSWVDPPPARLYTHKESETLHLRWRAEARELVVQTLGSNEQLIPLSGQTDYDLPLPLGRHQIFLRRENKSSQALNVEIWKAPLLHLVSPLPRNRVRLHENVAFLWMTSPGVQSYEFVLKGAAVSVRRPAGENSLSVSMDHEDDAEWSVEGKDADGFTIPPLYTYPIYIREAPLAAPKLRQPSLRQPAKVEDGRGASFWLSVLPQASADELLYQATFDWDKVEGADRYVIEISETPDFRTPLVNKTVTGTQFVWKKMALKTYYWRVAGETRSGRLGLFSDPEMVDLTKPDQTGVAVTPMKPAHAEAPQAQRLEPEPEPVAVNPPEEKVEKSAEPAALKPAPQPESTPEPELLPRTFFEWTPAYALVSTTAADHVRADLSGANPVAFALGADRKLSDQRYVRSQLNYSHVQYRPTPADQYPAQSKLSWSEITLTSALHNSSSHWGYGMFVNHGADIARESESTVQTRATNEIGALLQDYFVAGKLTYSADYIGMVGTDYGLSTRQALRIGLCRGFYLGFEVDGTFRFKTGGHTNQFSGAGLLGVDF